MKSIGQVLKLRPGCLDEYKRRHEQLWPELAEAMQRLEINMVIYQFNDYLFIHGTAPSKAAWQKLAEHPVTPRWDKYMAEIMETDERGELIVHDLPLAFAFGQFKP